MSDFDLMMEKMQHFNWWLIPKMGTLFLLGVMMLFGFLVLRQIRLMERVVSGTTSRPLVIIAWFGLAFTLLVFLLALFIL